MRAILILMLLVPTSCLAQKIFKCKNPDGSTSYQQTQCDDEASTLDSRHVPREADSSGPAYLNRRRERASDFVVEGSVDELRVEERSKNPELVRRLKHRQDSLLSATGKSEFDERRRADLLREINAIEAQLGLQPTQPAQPRVRQVASQPPAQPESKPPAQRPIIRSRDTGFGNKKYTDQYGNVYRANPSPGTNHTRLTGPNGERYRCTTDPWGNERCN